MCVGYVPCSIIGQRLINLKLMICNKKDVKLYIKVIFKYCVKSLKMKSLEAHVPFFIVEIFAKNKILVREVFMITSELLA